jgi:DNA-binding transcriptional ArsR family regulator
VKHETLESELASEAELLAVLTAVANPLRLRVVAELFDGRVHVSELARRLGISRPLLYMHLDRLEKAGLITGQLELSEDGKAMKYYELAPFELRLDAQSITVAVRSGADDNEAARNGAPELPKEESET